jgi:hypothetical protein
VAIGTADHSVAANRAADVSVKMRVRNFPIFQGFGARVIPHF